MDVEKLPTQCSTCGKKLDTVEVLFHGVRGYCFFHERGATQARQKRVCDICATTVLGKHAQYLHGLYYCDEYIPPSS
ncbi:MAG: hypothetical protein NVSMB38_45280 [Ktedonobacteraceae bacterium]